MIAHSQNITVTQVMEPHKEGLSEIIPLRKHLLRHQGFKAQIGMMEGNTFCTSLQPRLFTIGKKVILVFDKVIEIRAITDMLHAVKIFGCCPYKSYI